MDSDTYDNPSPPVPAPAAVSHPVSLRESGGARFVVGRLDMDEVLNGANPTGDARLTADVVGIASSINAAYASGVREPKPVPEPVVRRDGWAKSGGYYVQYGTRYLDSDGNVVDAPIKRDFRTEDEALNAIIAWRHKNGRINADGDFELDPEPFDEATGPMLERGPRVGKCRTCGQRPVFASDNGVCEECIQQAETNRTVDAFGIGQPPEGKGAPAAPSPSPDAVDIAQHIFLLLDAGKVDRVKVRGLVLQLLLLTKGGAA